MELWLVLSFFAAILSPQMYRGDCATIVGGKESAPHSRPYMAALMKRNRFFCGGTLIQGNWVLTAAHCPVEKGATVVLGAHSLSKNETEKQIFEINRMVAHPKYNKRTKENDIMLLQLDRKAKITRDVKIIRMPRTYDDIKAGTQCLVTGWGSTENGGKASDTLREADVTVIDRHICKKRYNSKPVVSSNMVCAGGSKRTRTDTCKGDSGGPLICGGIQRGITSFGQKGRCGDPKYPGVYTRLTKDYLEWIKKIMGGNLD